MKIRLRQVKIWLCWLNNVTWNLGIDHMLSERSFRGHYHCNFLAIYNYSIIVCIK